MRYLLINKENDFLVEHILPAREGWEFNADLYPDYYMVYEDMEDKIDSYNMRFNQDTGEFEEVEGLEAHPVAEVLPSDIEILQEQLNMMQIATLDYKALEEENKTLRSELQAIKEHLGIA